MAERGPLPKIVARRRNKRPATGKHVTVARPTKPRDLTGEAAAEWNRIVPELEEMGLVTRGTRALLIQYCTTWANWVDLDEKLRLTGLLVKGRRKDEVVRNPLWLMRRDAAAELADLTRLLVLGPAARLRAGVTHDRPVEEAAPAGPTALDEYRMRLAK